jgi:hypothetical protein
MQSEKKNLLVKTMFAFIPIIMWLLLLVQIQIYSDLMSWPLWHVCVNLSLNIFFSETTLPRRLISCRNVPWVVLLKNCSYGYEILNSFRTGSEKLPKIA